MTRKATKTTPMIASSAVGDCRVCGFVAIAFAIVMRRIYEAPRPAISREKAHGPMNVTHRSPAPRWARTRADRLLCRRGPDQDTEECKARDERREAVQEDR